MVLAMYVYVGSNMVEVPWNVVVALALVAAPAAEIADIQVQWCPHQTPS